MCYCVVEANLAGGHVIICQCCQHCLDIVHKLWSVSFTDQSVWLGLYAPMRLQVVAAVWCVSHPVNTSNPKTFSSQNSSLMSEEIPGPLLDCTNVKQAAEFGRAHIYIKRTHHGSKCLWGLFQNINLTNIHEHLKYQFQWPS